MYSTFFNRDIETDSSGKNYWSSKLNSGIARRYVFTSFVNWKEFGDICTSYNIVKGNITITDVVDRYPDITAFTYRFYSKSLDRKPDQDGPSYWANRLVLSSGTAADMAFGF